MELSDALMDGKQKLAQRKKRKYAEIWSKWRKKKHYGDQIGYENQMFIVSQL